MTMISDPASVDVARSGYAETAACYDDFTSYPSYGAWVAGLADMAVQDGLLGREALDVACGTGKSTLALLEAGYRVTGCDGVEEMLDQARRKLPDGVRLLQAPLTELGQIGSFDLITAINDVVNCLITEADVAATFAGLAANLAPAGRIVFDLNTPLTYRGFFAGCEVRERGEEIFVWRGHGDHALPEGALAQADLEVFSRAGDGYRRRTSHHIQRHHSLALIESLLADAGLVLRDVQGLNAAGMRQTRPDERSQIKFLCLAGRSS